MTAPTYDELRAGFRWALPERVNIGVEVCDRQPPGDAAILVTDGRELIRVVSFGELASQSNRLANALARTRRRSRRPGRRRPPPAARNRARAHRRVQARRDRRPAQRPVRAGGAGGAPPQRGRPRRDRRGRRGAEGRRARLRRAHARRRPRLRAAARGRLARVRAGADDARHAGAAHLHLRHDRAAEGGAARPSRAGRAPARLRALARLLPAAAAT